MLHTQDNRIVIEKMQIGIPEQQQQQQNDGKSL